MTVETGDGLPPVGEVIRRHGIAARKSLGQNFLLDLNLTGRIARSTGDLSMADVIEIGPGPGGLTRALLAAGARRVHAIERDDRCLAALDEIAATYPGRLIAIAGDAMSVDPGALGDPPRQIVANLPYNVATALLLRWLDQLDGIAGMTLMFQSEVADRLTAMPGTKAYGRLSVITQWLCEAKRLFNVAPSAFTPPPKVRSSVVSLTPRPEPLFKADKPALETVTAAAFGQRRKMLRASLKPLHLDLEAIGIDPKLRAENLDVKAFCQLARAYADRTGANR